GRRQVRNARRSRRRDHDLSGDTRGIHVRRAGGRAGHRLGLITAAMPDAAPILELHEGEKVYGSSPNPLRVPADVNLRVEEGEYVAVVGPSGSGKSTLLNILGCLDSPTRGSYRIRGQDVARLDDRQLSQVRNARIGFVFQSFQLVSHLTVQENVE